MPCRIDENCIFQYIVIPRVGLSNGPKPRASRPTDARIAEAEGGGPTALPGEAGAHHAAGTVS